MAVERSADDIQRDIEQSRVALGSAIDQLAYRTNPKRLMDDVKQSLREKARTPQGRIALGAAGGLVVVLIVRRVRKH